MEELNRYQKAALVSNTKRREKALKQYNDTPNICKYCEEPIAVGDNQKVSEVRKKVFCNHSCSAKYHNLINRVEKKIKEPKIKTKKFEYILLYTKKELFDKHENYFRFRAMIRKHAHYVFNINNEDKKCKICGYTNHVEVCHIKSVSSFDDNSLIKEINSIDNLVGLCPNHHWEFDNNKIIL